MQSNITRIGARKCTVSIIEKTEANEFIDSYHRQKSTSNVKVRSIGLFLEGDLLAVAQFCATRTSGKAKKYTTELLRLCFKSNVRVPGGASKLINWYIKKFDPSDIFTYQDATGELTDVYKHAGFTLVSSSGSKEYLVAPGKTLATASRQEALGMAYAVRYGPDRILGTNLGEIKRNDGTRKSNIQIFIEDLGWHIEKTPADRVYEWYNPKHTHYTYKITSSNSEKYYYGVSHVKKAKGTIDDCLNDGYMGSGGQKFLNWKAKYKNSLIKEVIGIFETKAAAYEAESLLVADFYKIDRNCLNSAPGGLIGGLNGGNYAQLAIKTCPIHGEVNHRGDSCLRCVNTRTNYVGNCDKHGETSFQGLSCAKCSSENAVSLRECATHGETKHQGGKCRKCVAESFISNKNCEVHGLVKHIGDSCCSCNNERNVSLEICSIHGESKHIGGKCYTCSVQASVSERICPTHGLTKHIGDKCYSCRQTGYSESECAVHGLSKHRGGKCEKCSFEKKLKAPINCSLCGESFAPTNNRQKICTKEHYIQCEYCGEDMVYQRRKKTCSLSCGVKLSNLKKAGELDASKSINAEV